MAPMLSTPIDPNSTSPGPPRALSRLVALFALPRKLLACDDPKDALAPCCLEAASEWRISADMRRTCCDRVSIREQFLSTRPRFLSHSTRSNRPLQLNHTI